MLQENHKLKGTYLPTNAVDEQNTVVAPFIENIKTINILHNTATAYLFDKENLYIYQHTK